jgi:hypothetical protein
MTEGYGGEVMVRMETFYTNITFHRWGERRLGNRVGLDMGRDLKELTN